LRRNEWLQLHIRCEHLIYALIEGIGYKLYQTPNASKLLSKQNLQYLYHVGDNAEQEVYLQIWFPTENVLAVTYIRPVRDEYTRDGVWNHTILLPITDYLQLSQPITVLAPHFIREFAGEPLNHLEPIIIKC